ncbi:MAG: zinc-dependent alcohol dehydrogenase family protein [Candidatus Sericytochromatia bacterium]|nr:zinc-dependent alcohol dehydrogenase family protein [Candidatus Sericytochromatia bacterium]
MTTTLREVLCVAPGEDAVASVVVAEQGHQACPEDGILVAVRARPINPADLLLLNGRHVFQPVLPAHVGIEGAGVIVAVGPRSRHVVGTRVAIPWGGTWRDQMPLPDDGVLVLPEDVDLEQAAMLCVNPFTVMGLLEGVEPGATIVVNAATSALSRLLLAVARRRGLRVVGVVRQKDAIPMVEAAGAEQVVLEGPDLADRIRAVAPGPVVLALDAVAGAASGRLFDALADGGTLIIYGLLSSDKVELPASGVVFRNVHVRGFSRLRAYAAMTPERREAITAELLDLLRDGLLQMPVDGRYGLQDVKAALEHHLQPGRSGKVLLVS